MEKSRAELIKDLLGQREMIDLELAKLKQQLKEEKAAFAATRKPRKAKG